MAIVNSAGVVTSVVVGAGGSLYDQPVTVNFPCCGAAVTRVTTCPKTGAILKVTVMDGGSGYNPQGEYFNSALLSSVFLEYQPCQNGNSQYDSTQFISTPVLGGFKGSMKDSTQCTCRWPTDPAAACTCVSYGWIFEVNPPVSCALWYRLVVNAANVADVGILVQRVPISGQTTYYPPIEVGQTYVFHAPSVTPAGMDTRFRVVAPPPPAHDPTRRFLQRLIVTVTTPDNSNILCTGYTGDLWGALSAGVPPGGTARGDCTALAGQIANLVTRTNAFPLYRFPPLVDIGISDRGVTLALGVGGTGYSSLPALNVGGVANPGFSAVTGVPIVDGGLGYSGTLGFVFSAGAGSVTSYTLNGAGTLTNIVASGGAYNGNGNRPIVYVVPDQQVDTAWVTAPGSGFSNTIGNGPSCSFPLPALGGTRATCTANVDGTGVLSSITVNNHGSLYTNYANPTGIDFPHIGPQVTGCTITGFGTTCTSIVAVFSGGTDVSGIGQINCPLSGGQITAVNIVNGGSFIYGDVVTVSFLGSTCATLPTVSGCTLSPGTGGVAYARLKGLVIKSAILDKATLADPVPNGNAVPASAAFTLSVPGTPGSCITGGTSASGSVTNFVPTNLGGPYTALPAVSFAGGFPLTTATVTATLVTASDAGGKATIDSNGAVTGVQITTPGSGYQCAPTVGFRNLGRMWSFEIVNPGYGYTVAPFIYIPAPGGNGRQAWAHTVITNGQVTGVVVDDPGSYYTAIGAASVIPFGSITSVTVVNCGFGYSLATTFVEIYPLATTHPNAWPEFFKPAIVTPIINVPAGGVITGFNIVDAGQGYVAGQFRWPSTARQASSPLPLPRLIPRWSTPRSRTSLTSEPVLLAQPPSLRAAP